MFLCPCMLQTNQWSTPIEPKIFSQIVILLLFARAYLWYIIIYRRSFQAFLGVHLLWRPLPILQRLLKQSRPMLQEWRIQSTLHHILFLYRCLKVSGSFGLVYAVDGLLGRLLCQLELRNGMAPFLRNLYHLPCSSWALDVLDAKVANLSRFQGRSWRSQEVTAVLPGKGERCDGWVEPDKGGTCGEPEDRECGVLWGRKITLRKITRKLWTLFVAPWAPLNLQQVSTSNSQKLAKHA